MWHIVTKRMNKTGKHYICILSAFAKLPVFDLTGGYTTARTENIRNFFCQCVSVEQTETETKTRA